MLPNFAFRALMLLHYSLFQMLGRPSRQVVRLTRCIDVPGHADMLVKMMSVAGYRWYPEYTVEEQYQDFNQSRYLYTVGYSQITLELRSRSIGLMDWGLLLTWQYKMLPIQCCPL